MSEHFVAAVACLSMLVVAVSAYLYALRIAGDQYKIRHKDSPSPFPSGPTSWTVKNRTTGELFAGYDADGDARWTDNKDNAVVFREYRSAEEVATMYGAMMEGHR